ncbi:hypothetical protein ABID46_002686, partial [Moheibacter stercoris]
KSSGYEIKIIENIHRFPRCVGAVPATKSKRDSEMSLFFLCLLFNSSGSYAPRRTHPPRRTDSYRDVPATKSKRVSFFYVFHLAQRDHMRRGAHIRRGGPMTIGMFPLLSQKEILKRVSFFLYLLFSSTGSYAPRRTHPPRRTDNYRDVPATKSKRDSKQ